jgi:uncharacterized protein (TIGR02466 family)
MPETFGLFSTPVVSFNLDRDFTEEELNSIISYSERTRPGLMGNRTTVGENVLDNPNLSDIRKFIDESLDWYVKNIQKPKDEFEVYLTQSFVNLISVGQGHHAHTHPNSYLSGVLYVQANQDNDSITFLGEPNACSKFFSLPTEDFNVFNSHRWSMPVWTGRLLIFPSNVPHQVNPVNNSYERISLAFNTFIRGEIGMREEYSFLSLKS